MTIPGDPPHDHAALFRLERTRLLATLRALEPAEWQRPTACPGWDVLGLVHHLVGDDLGVVAWHRDDHRGAPPPGAPDDAAFVHWLDELQADWVRAARRISPRLAVELLDWLLDPILDAFAGADLQARTAHVTWASDAPVPLWFDHAREVTERWIHRQQLREAVRQPTDLDEVLAGPVLDALRWAYPYRLGRAGATGRVLIELTEPFRRTWHLADDGDGWAFTARLDGPPTAELAMTVDQAWRLLTNNFDEQAHGPLGTVGDLDAIAVLLDTRGIIGSPRRR